MIPSLSILGAALASLSCVAWRLRSQRNRALQVLASAEAVLRSIEGSEVTPESKSSDRRLSRAGVARRFEGFESIARNLEARSLHLSAIIEAEPECVKTLDASGALLDMNPAGLRMIEADCIEQVRGQLVFGLLRPGWEDAFREMHEAVLRGEPRSLIFELVGLKGTRRWMETHAVPLHTAHGATLHLAVTHDITARKRQEVELLRAKEQAEASSVAKTEFLANMSHELRTPLTAILGYVDLLSESDNSAEEQRFGFETIRSSANHLLALISDILDVSKIEANKLELELRPMGLAQLVQEVTDSLRARADAQGIGLHVELRGPVALEIHSDALRIRQILTNLLGNAIKFTERGEVRVQLSCPPAASAEHGALSRLELAVSDTGLGIPAKAMASLFSAFTQADSSTTRRFGGTGLGLAISSQLAAKLGGEIRVQSTLGEGSCFTLILDVPASTEAATLDSKTMEPRAALPRAAASRAESHEPLQRKDLHGRVLVVEDNPVNRKVIRKMLERLGLAVSEANDGQQGLELAMHAQGAGAAFDIVLMDMHMPIMDGYSATQKLREQNYRSPIIALTASAMRTDRTRCLEIGCDDFVTKPIQLQLLKEALQRHLKRSESESRPG